MSLRCEREDEHERHGGKDRHQKDLQYSDRRSHPAQLNFSVGCVVPQGQRTATTHVSDIRLFAMTATTIRPSNITSTIAITHPKITRSMTASITQSTIPIAIPIRRIRIIVPTPLNTRGCRILNSSYESDK
jgi:hypothetical protein